MDNGQPQIATNTIASSSLVGAGNALASPAQGTELDRVVSCLDSQEELIMALAHKLQSVSHSYPSKEGEDRAIDHYTHISNVADRLERNNQVLGTLLERLAV